MSRRLALAAAVAALALSCDAGAVASATHWRIAAAMLHDGRLFAKTTVTVAEDRPATVTLDGDAGYSLSVVVEDVGRGRLRLNAALETAYGSMSPAVVLRPGQTAKIAIDHLGLVMKVFPER
jgi:hypothetical protein